ncbi:TolB family protein [Bacteroidota bacterium]
MKSLFTISILGILLISSCTNSTEPGNNVISIDTTDNLTEFDTTDYKILFVSDRGNIIKKQVYIMDKDGSNQIKLTDDDNDYYFPQISPNKEQIIFYSHAIGGNDEIYSVNIDGSGFMNLSQSPGKDVLPEFSNDGSKIVFSSNRDGNSEIYIMNADGSGQTRLTNNDIQDHSPQFCCNGTRILYYTVDQSNNKLNIYIMDSDGGNNICLTYRKNYHLNIFYDDWASMMAKDATPRFSPDESKIVFMSFNFTTVNYEIYIMDSDGQNHNLICDHFGYNISPQFTPSGNKIIFRSHRGENHDIYSMNLDGSYQRDLLNDIGHAYMPDISECGGKILYSTDRFRYYHIWIMDSNGLNQIQLTDGNYNDYCAVFVKMN